MLKDKKGSTHVEQLTPRQQWKYKTPEVVIKLEVVSYIEKAFTLGDDGMTIGQRVDSMISDCMDNHVDMRTMVINLSDMHE